MRRTVDVQCIHCTIHTIVSVPPRPHIFASGGKGVKCIDARNNDSYKQISSGYAVDGRVLSARRSGYEFQSLSSIAGAGGGAALSSVFFRCLTSMWRSAFTVAVWAGLSSSLRIAFLTLSKTHQIRAEHDKNLSHLLGPAFTSGQSLTRWWTIPPHTGQPAAPTLLAFLAFGEPGGTIGDGGRLDDPATP